MNRGRYPWDEWFEKKQVKLKKGKHFDCQPGVMAQQIRNAARSRRTRVSIQRVDDVLLITNWGDET